MAIFTRNGIHDAQGSVLEQAFYKRHGYTEAPVVIQCYITLRCGLSCAHCLAAASTGIAELDMPLALFDQLCREARELGAEEMLLTGGEPLQRQDLGDIVECLRRHHLPWSLNTATCPNDLQQAAIASYPPGYVAVSLDGPAHVHNAFRGNADAFDDAMSAIRHGLTLLHCDRHFTALPADAPAQDIRNA